MKLFDSHSHIYDCIYHKDGEDIYRHMKDAGVERVMIVGTNLKDSGAALDMARSKPGYYAAVGIHPHDAGNCSDKGLEHLRTLAKDAKVRAWGEIGLDFNRMYASRKDQEACLIKQLAIADELNLPVIFHERDSNGRLLQILHMQKNSRPAVIHCFSGNKAELHQYLNLGYHIGITGIVTLKKRGAPLRALVSDIPYNRILIETDAPYLTPAPQKNRTRRNEPAFVHSVLLKLSEITGVELAELAQIIWNNTCRLFKLPAA
jgi:TatD DNase family protein